MAEQFTVTSRQFIAARAEDSKTLRNAGGDTVYYGPSTVTSASYTGTVALGGSFTFSSPLYFVSGGSSRVLVEDVDEVRERIEAISVKDFGAIGDGTTDDRTAINQAVAKAERLIAATGQPVTVVFPPGVYYCNTGSAVYAITKSLSNWLILSGYGAQVKLGASCPRFLDFNRTADYDTFQKVRVEGFRLDFNNVGGKHHCIIGNYQDTVSQQRLNYADIHIRDVEAFNLVTDAAANTDRRYGVWLGMTQQGAGETAVSAERITLERVKVTGGNAGFFIGGNFISPGTRTSGYTQFIDDIKVIDCAHDTGSVPAAAYQNQVNLHIGEEGYGGRVQIVRFKGRSSSDTGIEVNGLNDCSMTDCVIEEAAGYAYYLTNYNVPYQDLAATTPAEVASESQIVLYRNCKARRYSAPTGTGFRVNYNDSVAIGTVVYENCSWHRTTADSSANLTLEALGYNGPGKALVVRGFQATIEGENYTDVGALSMSLFGTATGPRNVTMRDVRVYYEGQRSGSPGNPALSIFDLRGDASTGASLGTTLDIENVQVSLNLTNWASIQVTVFNLAGSSVDGLIRRVSFPSLTIDSGTLNTRGLNVSSSGSLAINGFVRCSNWDFRNFFSGTTEFSYGDATNRAKIAHENHVPRAALLATPGTPQTVTSAGTMTLPDTGSGFYSVTGTTTITSVTSSYVGRRVTLSFAGILTLTDGSNLVLAGNFVTSADDTITLVCDGTNWIEVARAAN